VANQLIGYIVALIVIVGFGFGLSRWFDWRRSLQHRLLDAAEGGGDV
jgi:hypothetical protein